MAEITVRYAHGADVEPLAQLFDQYRQFYRQPPDAVLAKRFISERLVNRDSIILVASVAMEAPLAFAQLYPTLCSVSAAPIYILYDLFVAASARRRGMARALMAAARAHAEATDAVRLELATARTNQPAQALYESLGWVRDQEFDRYNLELRS